MSTIEEQEDLSYLLRAHALVKKAKESEGLGLIEEAIEYNFQASNFFSLAINQTTHGQTIEALKVLSLNHYNKSEELKARYFLNNSNSSTGGSSTDIERQQQINKHQQSNSIQIQRKPQNIYFMQENTNQQLQQYHHYSNTTSNNISDSDEDFNQNLESTIELYLSTGTNKIDDSYAATNTPMALGSSPPSSFWLGIEKLLDILPKPIFGNKSNRKSNSYQDARSLTDSFYLVNNNNHHHLINQPPTTTPTSPVPTHVNSTPVNTNVINNNSNQKPPRSPQQDHQFPLEMTDNNNTIKILMDENTMLRKENDFLKDRILQFRKEIEKKTTKIRSSQNTTQSTFSHTQINNPHSSINNHLTVSLSSPTTTTQSLYIGNDLLNHSTTVNTGTLSSNSSNELLLREIHKLKEQLEKKDEIIDSQNRRWNQLLDSAKKKREQKGASTMTSTISKPTTTASPLTASIIDHHDVMHQSVPNSFY
ncbi:hypothetical protein DLAC_11019 [Tieghemostelium lacteum]|uniref:MIT domain-containing protein n=1 Tax=Tieghemostelium lacteum TaxID=361077 RepID=A0A151Z2Z4_TIELA|nr:hypothetical protein DLAC_11019 [Tieghemostelium lacteum]|eukprot:KYQ88321.1 hypothetical protein DLAC_11019 [Tieghemostelium lacteum]